MTDRTAAAPTGASRGGRGSRTGDAPLDPRAILTSIGEVVYDWDLASDTLNWSLNARDVFGSDCAQRMKTGRGFAAMIEPGTGIGRHEIIRDSGDIDRGTGIPYRTRYALRLGARTLVMTEDTGRWFADAEGRPATAHGVLRVERLGVGRTISLEAVTSGAARSRAGLIAELGVELAEAARARAPLALVVVAIEELGRLNEEIGYEAADGIIEQAFARIAAVMRRRDRLMRYASNRFAAILLSCTGEQIGAALNRFATAVESTPMHTGRGAVAVKLRMGAALGPEHGREAETLLRHAEEALAEAKRRGGATFAVYDAALGRDLERRRREATSLDIVAALNERRIAIARQPVVEARTRKVAFQEVLLRLHRADGTLANAADVVPAAERLGLVRLVDHRVLELALDRLAAEPQERLAINVSPATLKNPEWLTAFAAHLGARAGIADRLIVEITETAAVENPEATRACLDAMKALGVAIAIDDFGSGHTSFKLLRAFPVDILKIDGAFVQNLVHSPDDRFFVRTLTELAQHLGIATVAEWVENEETARLLTEWGVDYLQGAHIALPTLHEAADARASQVA
ncbi:GGDEF domain-containing phosphodiesterase [Chelatococcus sp. SYSU_G07232]|uniref:GGDEF domain-containing phosphodiesterase n=1 Tax=Chelatococcus albus TaxID=3047466 RepID=A0ABT7ADL8_9HYPH|nr:GGDEF domain-containing phosphodiesterase [Chelatococcus sp. SYSU_G07232]MDJ1157476.1 GGDEF domain-containing phosphodiesterase [Chelatococcus sp. SYSU_G07232]